MNETSRDNQDQNKENFQEVKDLREERVNAQIANYVKLYGTKFTLMEG
ncbi:hypothetical protein SCBWM1_gp72 [Synechococcus phage S-CBWM1]|uniref:Uncharacterized protein n=1 Tax=Synechococcus phage S-CBWM1 TaxID=2053653 RepID=A0A3G1L3K1_9CAUD|nr:hypothetical protein HOU61_gp125 [Synechococcus phage S-CBWM1]ATW62756.1 hypothetical protein SCBWM1_gp72 [Synechococcus phage S-CBWM1]